jgi:mRNA interferase MazF
MSEPGYWPDAGELIWTDFDPTLGREQAGRRPALAISPKAFALNTGFALVCPITTRVRPFPTSVVLPEGLPIAGEILISHLRSIDILARAVSPVGATVPAETAEQVRAKLAALIAI